MLATAAATDAKAGGLPEIAEDDEGDADDDDDAATPALFPEFVPLVVAVTFDVFLSLDFAAVVDGKDDEVGSSF